MPITIEWDDEAKTMLRIKTNGQWTAEDHYLLRQKVSEMLETVSHRVNAIVFFPHIRQLPPDTLRQSARFMEVVKDKLNHVVVVSDSSLVLSITSTFIKLYPAYARVIHVASSEEHAHAILAQQQPQTN